MPLFCCDIEIVMEWSLWYKTTSSLSWRIQPKISLKSSLLKEQKIKLCLQIMFSEQSCISISIFFLWGCQLSDCFFLYHINCLIFKLLILSLKLNKLMDRNSSKGNNQKRMISIKYISHDKTATSNLDHSNLAHVFLIGGSQLCCS